MYVDGTIAGTRIIASSINADRLVASTITSDSGKIGALSLKSLSIADFAVVVPVAETRGDAIGVTAGAPISWVTLSFDTIGLAGKPLTIIAGFVGQTSYSGTGANPNVTMKIDGVTIQNVATNNSSDWHLALSASQTITATGGSESHLVEVWWAASSTGNPQLLGRTVWAMVGKR
jgi:hypothetical protein